jgi:hypothetical protein
MISLAKHHKNISILLDDVIIDRYFGVNYMLGENSDPYCEGWKERKFITMA